MNAREIARRLGGEVSGRDAILCPGPGHSPKDRSITMKLDPTVARLDFRFTATSEVLEAQRPAGKASPSPIKEIATARRHSRPWPKEFVCTMSNIPPLDRPQGRAGNDITCANCDKRLRPKRGSRRMRFCGVACRQSAFRAKKWASRYEGPVPLRSVRKTPAGSTDLERQFWGSRIGHSRADGVISRELFDGLIWTARRVTRWCPSRNRPAWNSS